MQEETAYAPYARLSQAAYFPAKAAEMVAADGYTVDAELSNRNRTTFFNPATRQAVVAFRGTHITNPSDLFADYLIATGRTGLSTRFATSASVVRKANKKYGQDNVTVTGHSLGGAQALDVNRKLGNKAWAFSPGAGLGEIPWDILRGAFTTPAKKKKQNATIVTSIYDPISFSSLFGPENKIIVKPRYKNPHSLKNFYTDKVNGERKEAPLELPPPAQAPQQLLQPDAHEVQSKGRGGGGHPRKRARVHRLQPAVPVGGEGRSPRKKRIRDHGRKGAR
jgi:hypothetical protein